MVRPIAIAVFAEIAMGVSVSLTKRDRLYCEFTIAGATDKPGYRCSIEFKTCD